MQNFPCLVSTMVLFGLLHNRGRVTQGWNIQMIIVLVVFILVLVTVRAFRCHDDLQLAAADIDDYVHALRLHLHWPLMSMVAAMISISMWPP